MENFLKRVAFLGLGTVAATKEKIEKGVEAMVKKGEITAAQGKELAKKLWADADRSRKEMARKIDEGVKQGIAKAGFVRTKDMEELKKRIAVLERKLAAYEKKPPVKSTSGNTSGVTARKSSSAKKK